MWTATLISARRTFGRLDFEIEYLDDSDGETTRLTYSLNNATKKGVRNLARSEVARLDAFKNEVIDLPVGQSINIDPDAVVPPPDSTPAELARRAWFDDWQRLNQLLRLIAAVPALETAQATNLITNLKASLEADWLNSYLDNI